MINWKKYQISVHQLLDWVYNRLWMIVSINLISSRICRDKDIWKKNKDISKGIYKFYKAN